ncbi:type II toxin-antitoxin system VapB family antitoxin [Mycobacterium servetii]|uniref:Type II toxin-antitoxin system VapB family antitoxin n=1 Tax=Mycobacterium servetii TaxID=3237418 RepID=A0ABV4BZG5_9MYCO
MGLNVKNEHTVALVRELATRTGLTQTGAITEAVRSKLAELDRDHDALGTHRRGDARRAKARRLLDELHGSLTDAERVRLREAEGQLYDGAGLPS